MPRTLLTDDARNLTFECLHAEEAEFLFEEVFTRRSYCQSGVHVPKRGAPLVVDVGANIGLFSLFALTENPRATVIAVEPAPQLFAILERNLNHHFDTGAAECVRALMLDEPGVQTLYYYADAPGESTRNPFERSMQRKRLATAMREGSRGGTESSAMGEEDVADGHPIAVEARTLSQVLDAASLSSALSASTIALLKIDVEGDEEQHQPQRKGPVPIAQLIDKMCKYSAERLVLQCPKNTRCLPEVSLQLTNIYLTITTRSLEQQLLSSVVHFKSPEHNEQQTKKLTKVVHSDKEILKHLEDHLLCSLANLTGDLLDDVDVKYTDQEPNNSTEELESFPKRPVHVNDGPAAEHHRYQVMYTERRDPLTSWEASHQIARLLSTWIVGTFDGTIMTKMNSLMGGLQSIPELLADSTRFHRVVMHTAGHFHKSVLPAALIIQRRVQANIERRKAQNVYKILLPSWLSWDHMPGADGEGDIRQAAIMAAVDAINVLIHKYSSIGWDVGYYLRLRVQLFQLFEEHPPDTEVAAQSLTTIRLWVERGADPDGWKEDWGLDPAAAALRAAKKRDNGSAGKQGGGKEPKIPAEDPVPSVEQLQGAVPHLGETSAGLPTKQVAVAARPLRTPPVQAAKGKMPVGNNTAAKGPMDHFLKPTNTLQPQVIQWPVVKRVAATTFGKCTSVAGKLGGELGSHITNWSKFKVEAPPSAMLIGKYTDDCRAEGACVVATCDDKVIMITRVSLPTGQDGGQREWEVVKRVATTLFGKCTSVAGKLGSNVANWSKFKVEAPPTAMLLGEFTDGCRVEGACVVATCDDKVITITRVSSPTGEAGGEREWEVVQRVATATFGKCTSSAAAANYAESKSNPAM
eukprot:jgi/Chrpa1/2379/Chrysochromulina_OHIO_Genome00017427-RA